jgi:intracellular septation protein A
MQHFTGVKMEHIHPLKGTIMLKTIIRFTASVAIQTIYEAAIRLIVVAAVTKVVSWYIYKDVIVETDESTDSEES